MRLKLFFSVIGCLGLFSGCMGKYYNAKVNILPRANNEFVIHATSNSEGDAMEGAKGKADEYCEKLGKRMIIIGDPKTVYQGVTKEGLSGAASAIFGKGNSKDDYKVEITAKCE